MEQEKKTSPYLTRYERAKVISVRAQQLSIGKQPQIEVDGTNINHLEIALQELKEKKIQIDILNKISKTISYNWNLEQILDSIVER